MPALLRAFLDQFQQHWSPVLSAETSSHDPHYTSISGTHDHRPTSFADAAGSGDLKLCDVGYKCVANVKKFGFMPTKEDLETQMTSSGDEDKEKPSNGMPQGVMLMSGKGSGMGYEFEDGCPVTGRQDKVVKELCELGLKNGLGAKDKACYSFSPVAYSPSLCAHPSDCICVRTAGRRPERLRMGTGEAQSEAAKKYKEAVKGGDIVYRVVNLQTEMQPKAEGDNSNQSAAEGEAAGTTEPLSGDAILYEHPVKPPDNFDLVTGEFLFGRGNTVAKYGEWLAKGAEHVNDALETAAGKVDKLLGTTGKECPPPEKLAEAADAVHETSRAYQFCAEAQKNIIQYYVRRNPKTGNVALLHEPPECRLEMGALPKGSPTQQLVLAAAQVEKCTEDAGKNGELNEAFFAKAAKTLDKSTAPPGSEMKPIRQRFGAGAVGTEAEKPPAEGGEKPAEEEKPSETAGEKPAEGKDEAKTEGEAEGEKAEGDDKNGDKAAGDDEASKEVEGEKAPEGDKAEAKEA
ncbi:unnamed protein product [Amoebophrya sp. A120]|nr:unnamed protein product [Amoebophrya sp. A120]|eukprot:GSA120T00013059001.1